MGSKKSHHQPILYTHHQQHKIKSLILKTNTRFLIGIAKPIGKAKKGNLVNKMVKDLKIATKTLKQLFQMKALSKSQKPLNSKNHSILYIIFKIIISQLSRKHYETRATFTQKAWKN